MQYLLIAVVLMVLCLFGYSFGRNHPSSSKQDHSTPPVLEELTLPPEEFNPAMCYVPILVDEPTRIDYICPTCGEKTLYSTRPSTTDPNVIEQPSDIIWKLSGQLEYCRRVVAQIKNPTMTLDESQLCSHCSPGAKAPRLALTIQSPDRSEPHRVSDVRQADLQLLKEYSEGKLDIQKLMPEQRGRLEELLGTAVVDPKGLSRQEIQNKLAILAKSLPPTDLDEGTSFGPSDIPKSVAYECPDCGHKTEYAFKSEQLLAFTRNNVLSSEEKEHIREQYIQSQNTRMAVHNLDACHQVIESISNLKLTLDESRFCSKCTSPVESPELGLNIHYQATHYVKGVSLTDLNMLKAFTEGKLKYKNSESGESALKDQVVRLEELLGEKLNRIESPYLSRHDIKRQLARIAKSPPPSELSMGAMCYMTVNLLDRVEYICPICSEKTLYAKEDLDSENTSSHRSKAFWKAANLDTCRRLVQSIYQVDISLDEVQFCNHCSPDIDMPDLGIIIRYPDNENVHRTWGITDLDLIMLRAATNSKLKYKDWQDCETALKDQLPRLKELLGMTLNDADTKGDD